MVKIEFTGYLESDAGKEEVVKEFAKMGLSVEEAETVSRVSFQQQLQAVIQNYDRVVISSCKISFDEDSPEE